MSGTDVGENDDSKTTAVYLVHHGCLSRRKQTRDGVVIEPLCNFSATVTEELVLDDGADPTRAFIIEGQLDSGERLPPARVPAGRFSAMSWVPETWGLRAVVRAGATTRDYLREAIQRLSSGARSRHVFTHTGWREIGGQYLYLMSNGAVGHDGYEVDLGPELSRYQLPRTAEDPAAAMRASLGLLDVAPLRVTVPLWAAVFRAVLAEALPIDLALWLLGQSGALKSTLAALFLSHFGTFDRLHLSDAWISTANALERRAFQLKDVLFVIDDYAPSGPDGRELEVKAARLLRAQGNLAGRGRLRADLSQRPAFPPRGLILATGEALPPGRSVLARTVVVELDQADVNLQALSTAQALAPRLPHALAGYVAWLAPQMGALPGVLRETFAAVRGRAGSDGEHLRVPEALTHLWIGLDVGLRYASEIGACSATDANALREKAWEALLGVGRAQGRLVEEERPTRRFLKVLLAILRQRKGVLLPRDEAGGDSRPGELLGWQDEEALYLMPEAAFQAVGRFCRDAGEPFPVREDRLRRELAKEGLSECDPERHTATVRVCGKTHRVLQIKRAPAERIVGEEFPSPVVTTVTGPEW